MPSCETVTAGVDEVVPVTRSVPTLVSVTVPSTGAPAGAVLGKRTSSCNP
jgi:hypothetical protein